MLKLDNLKQKLFWKDVIIERKDASKNFFVMAVSITARQQKILQTSGLGKIQIRIKIST